MSRATCRHSASDSRRSLGAVRTAQCHTGLAGGRTATASGCSSRSDKPADIAAAVGQPARLQGGGVVVPGRHQVRVDVLVAPAGPEQVAQQAADAAAAQHLADHRSLRDNCAAASSSRSTAPLAIATARSSHSGGLTGGVQGADGLVDVRSRTGAPGLGRPSPRPAPPATAHCSAAAVPRAAATAASAAKPLGVSPERRAAASIGARTRPRSSAASSARPPRGHVLPVPPRPAPPGRHRRLPRPGAPGRGRAARTGPPALGRPRLGTRRISCSR